MKVLVIGSGAREHALVWKIAQSPKVKKIYCAPGNGGIAEISECVNIKSDDIKTLLAFALEKEIDLTVVGPELPLVKGITDEFQRNGLKVFGPNKKASKLEGSKIYSKNFMEKYDIPTAKYKSYEDFNKAYNDLENYNYPLVIKADGLAAGKGVLICEDVSIAKDSVEMIMKDRKFGKSGSKIVIEEFLEGIEASLLCLIDGERIIPMESARDYKKALDNDKGLNTGGMGCFSPNPIFNDELKEKIQNEILNKIKIGFDKEGIDFKGVLFIGLMINENSPKVLEFNVRLGDPETEVVLPRLKSDLVDILEKTIDGNLYPDDLKWSEEKCVTVFLASGGYPSKYEKNKVITGLDNLNENTFVFHGGTKKSEDKLLTNGGRVLAVTSMGESLEMVRASVYKEIEKINFDKMFFRKDIAKI
ncbi:MAG: phosphoribosylamine--glycine ligase [Firmicutes bacterium]|nr:phosphoribosylamine--glycine ligase [Bacillota bacterium]